MDAPEDTLSAALRASAVWLAVADMSTLPVSKWALMSLLRTEALTVGVSVFSAAVPAAAAATRPKLAAAALTSALEMDSPRALTVSVLPTVISVLPDSVVLSLSTPLWSISDCVTVLMVLKACAPPPATEPPMLAATATATAVEDESILALS